MTSTRTRRFSRIGAATAALVLLTTLPAAADGPNLVVNGNFTEPTATLAEIVTTLPGWDLIDGEARIIGPPSVPVPAGSPAGTQTLSLNATNNISVEQAVPTEIGKTYRLSFMLGGFHVNHNAVNGEVRIDGESVWPINFNTNQTSPLNPGWSARTVTFIATSTTSMLNLQSTTPGGEGPLLTNITINEIDPDGAPLADASMSLMLLAGVAVVGVTVANRRRRTSTGHTTTES